MKVDNNTSHPSCDISQSWASCGGEEGEDNVSQTAASRGRPLIRVQKEKGKRFLIRLQITACSRVKRQNWPVCSSDSLHLRRRTNVPLKCPRAWRRCLVNQKKDPENCIVSFYLRQHGYFFIFPAITNVQKWQAIETRPITPILSC